METEKAARRAEGPVVVSVSGCYWSGSGAIVDLLSEHRDCRVVDGEIALFSYGQLFLETVLPRIAGQATDAAKSEGNLFRFREYNKQDPFPVRQVLRRVCSPLGTHPAGLYSIRAGTGKAFGEGYRRACADFLDAVEKAPGAGADRGRERIETSLRTLLRETVARAPGTGPSACKTAVLDQLVAPAYALSALEVQPDLRMIFVDRDWRDQYVEVRDILARMTAGHAWVGVRPSGEADSDYDIGPLRFFVNLRKRVAAIKASHAAEEGKRILWLTLEDSVLSHRATAERVFRFLDLDAKAWDPECLFVPEKSRKNLGKWKNSPHQGEFDTIAKEIGFPQG